MHGPFIRRVPIAICDLLIWAYRDQMVHVARAENAPVSIRSVGPRLAAMQFGADPVDASHGGGFSAAYDAWRVHDAVMALPETVAWRLSAADAAVLRARALVRGVVPDARPVAIPLRSIVFQAAVMARPPDWCPAPVYRWAHQDGEGRQRHAGPLYEGRRHVIVGHSITPVGFDPWDVVVARQHYSAWVSALKHIGAAVSGVLRDFCLTDDFPELSPWGPKSRDRSKKPR